MTAATNVPRMLNRRGWVGMATGMGLGYWEQYSNEELRYKRSELRQDERAAHRDAGKWSVPAENRRHASEVAANCAEMIREINAVLDQRHEEAAERREATARRREEAATRRQDAATRQQPRAA